MPSNRCDCNMENIWTCDSIPNILNNMWRLLKHILEKMVLFYWVIVRTFWMTLISEFRFCSISLEQIDRISPHFYYALMLTRSKLGLLPVIFRKFVTELLPLIDVIILFTRNIFRTNRYNFTKFYIAFTLRRFRLRLLPGIFRKFVTELWPLIDVRISFSLNLKRTNRHNVTFCICIDIDKI